MSDDDDIVDLAASEPRARKRHCRSYQSRLQEIVAALEVAIADIQNESKLDCSRGNYTLALAVTLAAGQILQRAWRFGAVGRYTKSHLLRAAAQVTSARGDRGRRGILWVDNAAKGGLPFTYALASRVVHVFDVYWKKWRNLVVRDRRRDHKQPLLFLGVAGKPINVRGGSSRPLMAPFFRRYLPNMHPMSNCEIRRLQESAALQAVPREKLERFQTSGAHTSAVAMTHYARVDAKGLARDGLSIYNDYVLNHQP